MSTPCIAYAAGEWTGPDVVDRKVLFRLHKSEEYTQELADDIAAQSGLGKGKLNFAVPVMRAVLKTWAPAAWEYTEWVRLKDGVEKLRTIFLITDYSDSMLFNLADKVLRTMGVGAKYDPRMPIAFVLLGGVLNEFGSGAGLPKDKVDALLAFRLDNSDFLTVTSWLGDTVEITNMVTGRVDTLKLGTENINKIIQHIKDVLWRKYKTNYKQAREVKGAYEQYLKYLETYDKVMAAFARGENKNPPLPKWKQKKQKGKK